MNNKELIEMLNILKESCENTIGNRINKQQKYTILSNISPDSFRFVIDVAIDEIKKQSVTDTRKRHIELCSRCIEVGSCPHDCEVCAWGDVMTERQVKQEKRTKNFYKEIMKYHRRHKNER